MLYLKHSQRLFLLLLMWFFSVSSLAGASIKIVSLAPFLTEWVGDFGKSNQIVAVSSACQTVRKLPIVSQPGYINLEAIDSLNPDVILAWENQRKLFEGYPQIDKVYFFSVERLEDFSPLILKLGQVLGDESLARRMEVQFRVTAQKIIEKRWSRVAKKVVYLASLEPPFVMGRESLIGDAILACGHQNVFPNKGGAGAMQIGLETLTLARSDHWLISSQVVVESAFFKRERRLIAHQAGWLEVPTMRFLLGLAWLCSL